ncbi:MAG: hypothetical protein IPO92_16865 [Saprospiraceae bacterium]|nr:hypothetical protein [Saprospiraceae bacterium]
MWITLLTVHINPILLTLKSQLCIKKYQLILGQTIENGWVVSASIAILAQRAGNDLLMAIEKCRTERSFKVEHDNARSDGTRLRRGGKLDNERYYTLADRSFGQCLHFRVISYHSNLVKTRPFSYLFLN